MKICKSCNLEKSKEDFRKNKNNPDGLEHKCRECRKEEQKVSYRLNNWKNRKKNYVHENIDKIHEYMSDYRSKNRDKIFQYEVKFHNNNQEKTIFKSARNRAKSRNIEFSIDLEDVVIPEVCPIFKTKLTLERGKGHKFKNDPYTPSIDRIDSSKGYIKGNVWVISSLANLMKANSTKEQLKMFCQNILNLIEEGTYGTNN